MFSRPGSNQPVQTTTLWPGHSIHGVHGSGKGGQIDGTTQGYKDPPVPRQLIGQSQTCLQHRQTLVALCQYLGWLVNMNKSELDPK